MNCITVVSVRFEPVQCTDEIVQSSLHTRKSGVESSRSLENARLNYTSKIAVGFGGFQRKNPVMGRSIPLFSGVKAFCPWIRAGQGRA
jgi:hypothetical protein